MQIRFDGKTVVVSGAGHGFGRCIAETFAGLGARVFGCDLSAVELAETIRVRESMSVLRRMPKMRQTVALVAPPSSRAGHAILGGFPRPGTTAFAVCPLMLQKLAVP
jgi:NAD(P)-dependent dehydrogenase (short-subunit alcohol dehydrogenase family)